MERSLPGGILLGLFLAVSFVGTANAESVDDFQSYSDAKALKRAWTFDPYQGGAQLITSYTLVSEKGNKCLEVTANLKDEPYFAVLQKQFPSHKNWSAYSRAMIKYKRVSGTSREELVFEILDASDWSHKWQSSSWFAPDEGSWHTQTVDISGCPWLKKVGIVRIVIKAKDYGTTTVDIDDIQLK